MDFKPVVFEKLWTLFTFVPHRHTRGVMYLVILLFWGLALACTHIPVEMENERIDKSQPLEQKEISQNESSTETMVPPEFESIDGRMPEILDQIVEGQEGDFGFSSRSEFKRSRLGLAYQEFSLPDEKPTGYWRVQVVVGEENRVLMTLKKDGHGEWAFAGLSGAKLARELGSAERTFERGHAKTQTGRIVRDFDNNCDYVQFNPVSEMTLEGNLYPLTSASMFLSKITGTHESGGLAPGYTLEQVKDLRLKIKEAREHR